MNMNTIFVKTKINICNCLFFSLYYLILIVLIIFYYFYFIFLFFKTFSILFHDRVTNKNLTLILDIYRFNKFCVFCLFHSRISAKDVFWCRCNHFSGRFDGYMAEYLPPHSLGRLWIVR